MAETVRRLVKEAREADKWEDKAAWLQAHGYPLAIDALGAEDENKWRVSLEGEYRIYGDSIPDVVSKIYDAIQYDIAHENYKSPVSPS
jgi:hypothetical protein